MPKINVPKNYIEVKHPVTGEIVRLHGEPPYMWAYVGNRGTGYKGRGKQIAVVGVDYDLIKTFKETKK